MFGLDKFFNNDISLFIHCKSSLSLTSKGKKPHNTAYKTIPELQISISIPLYFLPNTISGAA